MDVIFFWNGNTAVFQDGQQQPELQESWILLFARFLESKAIDPLQCTFRLPTNAVAKFVRTDDGSLNWNVY